jgi:hypothetical protein
MSINLGRLCANGVIVLADTCSYLRDGTTRRDKKIVHFDGEHIALAIADTSDDADAAKTLLNEIGSHLLANAKSWKDVETIIKADMTDWHRAFRKTPPTLFTGGILLKREKPEFVLCSLAPPRTITSHREGYVANGAGAWITDLIYDMLFQHGPGSSHPQIALRESAYLLYRADKANSFCRGIDGYYLDAKQRRLQHLDASDLKNAMDSSFQIDLALQTSMPALLAGGKWLESNATAARNTLLSCEKIRNIVFHDVAGNEIGA